MADTDGAPQLTVKFTKTGSVNDELDRLRFNGQGYAAGFEGVTAYQSGGTFTVCDQRGNDKARGLLVSPVGSVRAAVVDPNDPGSDDLADC